MGTWEWHTDDAYEILLPGQQQKNGCIALLR